MTNPGDPSKRLRSFVVRFGELLHRDPDENEIRVAGGALLAELLSQDDWLEPAYAATHPEHYQQYLLHCDSREKFSVISMVWGPGQGTPVHDHTVWGLVGVLRGAERAVLYDRVGSAVKPAGEAEILVPGQVSFVSPTAGDIHKVSNAFDDRTTISIHVYGANIGALTRHIFDPFGATKTFISGYANDSLPNPWKGA